MDISSQKKEDVIYLRLKGEITINETANLKDILLQNLAEGQSLELSLEQVTKIDTSGLQVLYSAYQTAHKQGKKLCLVKPSPEFIETARLAGLLFHTQEGHLEGCLWKGGSLECQKPS